MVSQIGDIFRDISGQSDSQSSHTAVKYNSGNLNRWSLCLWVCFGTMKCMKKSNVLQHCDGGTLRGFSNFSLRDLSTKGKYLVMLGIDGWLRQTRHQDRCKINTSIVLSSDVSVLYFTLHFKQLDVFMFTCKDLSYFEVCCSVCVNIGPILNYKFSSSPSASK